MVVGQSNYSQTITKWDEEDDDDGFKEDLRRGINLGGVINIHE